MDTHPLFGHWLQRRRKALDLTQADLGRRVGYARVTIHKIETDQLRPSRQMAEKLADELEIAPAEREAFLHFARDDPRADPPSALPALPNRPAVRAPIPRHHNLPARLTSFVGREREIGELRDLLGCKRLITLTGPGGIGKTSLAFQVAAGLIDHFSDGLWLVDLEPIRDPRLVASSIADVFGIRAEDGRSVVDQLTAHLHDKNLLLLLDNFEQVLPAASLISELLASAPELKVLVTSREVLRLRSEHNYSVPPLFLPDLAARPATAADSVAAVARSDAVRLFLVRAQQIRADLTVTEENAEAIAAICHRLDGLPLAIELAATRVDTLPPRGMLPRLVNQLKLLGAEVRDQPARHQTMRAAIAWSYDLLTEPERTLFRHLAVFDGGFALEAAEVIASGDDRRIDVLDGITALVDKSLLTQQEQPDGEPRFAFLETIHAFGFEKLESSGEAETIRRQHARYVVTLAERAKVPDADFALWLVRLDREHANVRAAFSWCRAHGEIAWQARLVAALGWSWLHRGHTVEVRAWAEETVLATASLGVHLLRAGVLYSAGVVAYTEGDWSVARGRLEESLALWHLLGDEPGVAWAQINLSNIARDHGDYDRARGLTQESLARFRAIGDRWAEGYATTRLGMLAVATGDHAAACDWHKRALVIYTELGDEWAVATTLGILGAAARARGDLREAARLFAESLTQSKYKPWDRGLAERVATLVGLAVAIGDLERAGRLVGATDARLRASGGGRLLPGTRAAYERDHANLRTKLGEEAFAQKVVEGRSMSLDAVIAEALAVARAATSQTERSGPDRLTAREVEVLCLYVADLSHREIGARLSIAPRTVSTHLTNIFGKIGVNSRLAAARYAHTHGLVASFDNPSQPPRQ